MNTSIAKDNVNRLKSSIRKLRLIDWNEVLGYVPDSEDLEVEIEECLNEISKATHELNYFFQ